MKNKKQNSPIEIFTLDLTDAILPNGWPSDIPLSLKLQTGQYEKKYDIISSDETWYKSLLKFVAKNQRKPLDDSLPIGVNGNGLYVGAKIYDANQNIVDKGKSKKLHFKEIKQESDDLEQKLIPLREKFVGIKDKYLLEFNEAQDSLLKHYRPLSENQTLDNVFSDILLAGGGSTYQDGSLASLGAYSSLLDFNVLKCTLDLFEKEELKLLGEVYENIAYLTPIHSLINGQIKAKNSKSQKPKMK